MSVGTLQIIWCAIFVVSQFLLSIATSYWMFIAGMMCFSLGLAGYSGLVSKISLENFPIGINICLKIN